MNKVCDHFLPTPALAQQQDRDINIGHQTHLLADFAHRGACGYEEDVIAQFDDIAWTGCWISSRRVGVQALPQNGIKLGLLEWLG
jgi:hypothetical protein